MILLALNELNLEYIQEYIKKGDLPNFKTLLNKGYTKTTSEAEYELLEPWIQWVTIQTGLTYSEHGVFRLGDIVEKKELDQIFEDLENKGLSVGAISPFNADNRLNKSKFFIPDPWTQTKASGGFLISKLSVTISKIVNSNASGRVGFMDLLWLLLGFLRFVRLERWWNFIKLVSIRKKPGVKAAILDMILLEVFVTLQKKNKPDYSHLFFNGGAHVQHHYLFNSSNYDGPFENPEWYCPKGWDPILMMLKTYDRIIGDLLSTGERIIGVTGLHQVPHDKQTFYWRPNKHKEFLIELGIDVQFNVIPRMSRDFLIETNSSKDATKIELILNTYKDSVNNMKVFSVDNRGGSLFVEIIYADDIKGDLIFLGNNKSILNLKNKLAFVAIKNGKHDGRGYVFSNKELNLPKTIELKSLYNVIKNFAISDFKKSN
jgi:hypothetical protein